MRQTDGRRLSVGWTPGAGEEDRRQHTPVNKGSRATTHGRENVYQYCDGEPQPRGSAPRRGLHSTSAAMPTGERRDAAPLAAIWWCSWFASDGTAREWSPQIPHGHPRGGSVTVRPDSALASRRRRLRPIGERLAGCQRDSASLEIWSPPSEGTHHVFPFRTSITPLPLVPLVGQTPTALKWSNRLAAAFTRWTQARNIPPQSGPQQQNDHEPENRIRLLSCAELYRRGAGARKPASGTRIVIGAPPHDPRRACLGVV